uniref:Uncharacterized protein n=1 Tax=Pyxicephalus adspersus TaxID=30357 RepID=A0AAV3ADZ8_PYXAD|nr:TPA: hypothetical protein GDO54_008056 [Pyxicephalus adspersus]
MDWTWFYQWRGYFWALQHGQMGWTEPSNHGWTFFLDEPVLAMSLVYLTVLFVLLQVFLFFHFKPRFLGPIRCLFIGLCLLCHLHVVISFIFYIFLFGFH